MDCILYIDLFFLWNFWMNMLILFIVRQITKTYRTLWCIFSAFCGALGACIGISIYIKTGKYSCLVIIEILTIITMCILSYGAKNIIWHLFLLLITGSVVSGVYLHIMTVTGIGSDAVNAGLISVCAFFCCVCLEKNCRIRWKEEHMKAKTVLEFGDRKLFATALIDTGNRLYDPFYQKPVILVNESMMEELICLCKQEYPDKLHFIPFHSVGKTNGLLEGITFDCVSIKWQNKKQVFHNVIAAATKESLYKGKEYQIIFHCGLLQEG